MRFLCIAFLLLMPVVMTGCGATALTRGADATGGLEITLFSRDSTGAETYYEVQRDGTIRFGGGMNARLNRVTWTGSLTAEEIESLRELLRQQEWFRRTPASSGSQDEHFYRIMISAPENRRTFVVRGESEAVRPIRDLLANASLRRLQPDLQRLPAPGPQR